MIGFLAHSATVGIAPTPGIQPVDGTWLIGLSGGLNNTFQSGITAAGTTQATATPLTSGIFLNEIDTAAASTGVNLPPCFAGTELSIYNNGAQTVTVYPAVANNPITVAQDTINNGTTTTIATHVLNAFSCAKNGVWATK